MRQFDALPFELQEEDDGRFVRELDLGQVEPNPWLVFQRPATHGPKFGRRLAVQGARHVQHRVLIGGVVKCEAKHVGPRSTSRANTFKLLRPRELDQYRMPDGIWIS
jgi:hypothetical protein